MQGTITKTHNRFYQVQIQKKHYLCSPKGHFKRADDLEYRLPVIGDIVDIDLRKDERQGVDGYITAIEPRKNRLIRADQDGRKSRVMAANLNHIIVVSACAKPGLDFALIDRYIMAAELAEIDVRLLINKIDLCDQEANAPLLDVYQSLGFPVMRTSVKENRGMAALQNLVGEGISFLTGTSGVGKSSLINALVPDADLAVGAVDNKAGRGRHTTTFSQLVPLPIGGYLADSPGLRDFYPHKVDPSDVRFGFREIAAIQAHCKFPNCLHDGEPGCAVWQAVEQEVIAASRFKSYSFLLGEMQTYAKNRY